MMWLKIEDIRPTKLLKKTDDVVSGSLKIPFWSTFYTLFLCDF